MRPIHLLMRIEQRQTLKSQNKPFAQDETSHEMEYNMKDI